LQEQGPRPRLLLFDADTLGGRAGGARCPSSLASSALGLYHRGVAASCGKEQRMGDGAVFGHKTQDDQLFIYLLRPHPAAALLRAALHRLHPTAARVREGRVAHLLGLDLVLAAGCQHEDAPGREGRWARETRGRRGRWRWPPGCSRRRSQSGARSARCTRMSPCVRPSWGAAVLSRSTLPPWQPAQQRRTSRRTGAVARGVLPAPDRRPGTAAVREAPPTCRRPGRLARAVRSPHRSRGGPLPLHLGGHSVPRGRIDLFCLIISFLNTEIL